MRIIAEAIRDLAPWLNHHPKCDRVQFAQACSCGLQETLARHCPLAPIPTAAPAEVKFANVHLNPQLDTSGPIWMIDWFAPRR